MENRFIVYIIITVFLIYTIFGKQIRYGQHEKRAVFWFHRPGCPYCDKMENDWNQVKDQLSNDPMYNIQSIDISKPENSDIASAFNVTTVPQITKLS
jgi:thioredoxin-related protein